jgi:hypothetical protein
MSAGSNDASEDDRGGTGISLGGYVLDALSTRFPSAGARAVTTVPADLTARVANPCGGPVGTKRSCLVADGPIDAAFPRAADRDRLVTQLRIVALLDRRVERVHIDLEQKTLQPLDNPFGTGLSPMS